MNDLQPYICTFPNCDGTPQTFPSFRQSLSHEILQHETTEYEEMVSTYSKFMTYIREKRRASVVCHFCGKHTIRGEKHIGRHMEEVAFAVVTKPYEEWEVYSDSLSDS